MNIKKVSLLEGAKNARGHVIIIDVFRAFSVACYVADKKPKQIVSTSSLESAYKLKNQNKNAILIGERGGKKIENASYGNSPTEIMDADLKDKIVIHTTSAGTQGLINAEKGLFVYSGSFLNAKAIADYLKFKKVQEVTLVAMGEAGVKKTDEDELCAEYIESLLKDEPVYNTSIVERLKKTSSARFFKEENQSFSPKSDFDLCLKFNSFDFILKAHRIQDDMVLLEKLDREAW